jgi:hypothetical protein
MGELLAATLRGGGALGVVSLSERVSKLSVRLTERFAIKYKEMLGVLSNSLTRTHCHGLSVTTADGETTAVGRRTFGAAMCAERSDRRQCLA